jgi:UDP-N-acetylglucosamine/UDP-N-acetylgalactosamine diphosphorylase
VADQADWESAGQSAIARGQVAVVLIATGLVPGDPSAPRVTQPVDGLPSGKCALQLFAERLARAQQLAARAAHGANAPVARLTHLYIMTSPDTHKEVRGGGRDRPRVEGPRAVGGPTGLAIHY